MLAKEATALFDAAECLYTQEQVDTALDTMAQTMAPTLKDTNPLVIAVLKGGMVTLGQLLVRLPFPLQVDYLHATRYQGGTAGGELHWRTKPTQPLKGRHLLIVDDILDGGITLKAIVDYCHKQEAKAVYTAVLADKTEGRSPEGLKKADFTGITLPNRYVVGYGMDCHEYWRNAPGIYAVNV